MLQRLSEIDARLRDLDEAVADLSRRLSAIEHPGSGYERPAAAPLLVPAEIHATHVDMTSALTLLGRTFIVLAGAFFLRALAESGRVPGRTGAILGLVYAMIWLAVADRQLGAVTQLSRLFHGLAAILIALPLLWEATTRFQFLSSTAAAATLAVVSVSALVVAWHRHLQLLAGAATIGVVIATPTLAIATDDTAAFTLLAVGIVVSTWLLGETRGWRWLVWPAALSELALIGILLAHTLRVPPLESAGTALALLALLLGTAVGPFLVRALRDTTRAGVFDAVYPALAVPIGLVGLIAVSGRISTVGPVIVGVALGAVGVALYALSFGRVLPRQGAGFNFYAGTSLALASVVVGASQVLAPAGLTILLSALAVAALWLSGRMACGVLALHATLLVVVVSFVFAPVSATLGVWIGFPAKWPTTTVGSLIALAVIVGAAIFGSTRPPASPKWLGAAAHVALNALALTAFGGALLIWLGPSVAGTPPANAVLATMKTGVLAAAAVALARVGRSRRWPEIAWLAYPVLAIGALQLVVEGIAASRAATLFVALAMYGVALVVSSRQLMHDR
jgi:hypothetical protein